MKCFKPSKETKKTLERLLVELKKSATDNSNAAIIGLYDAALKDGGVKCQLIITWLLISF